MYRTFGKRLFDITMALMLLLITLPVTIIISILLYFANGGKVFFLQKRPGKGGRVFKIVKFKTMNDKSGPNGELLPPIERITRLGKFVRQSSIDELPQLINVFRGELSLIGPRPLRVEYLDFYTQEQFKRHNVLPGITGWAQVNGRNNISWEERFKLDNWYVENFSFMLDVKIIFKTVYKILKRDGVNSKENEIMKPFNNVNLKS